MTEQRESINALINRIGHDFMYQLTDDDVETIQAAGEEDYLARIEPFCPDLLSKAWYDRVALTGGLIGRLDVCETDDKGLFGRVEQHGYGHGYGLEWVDENLLDDKLVLVLVPKTRQAISMLFAGAVAKIARAVGCTAPQAERLYFSVSDEQNGLWSRNSIVAHLEILEYAWSTMARIDAWRVAPINQSCCKKSQPYTQCLAEWQAGFRLPEKDLDRWQVQFCREVVINYRSLCRAEGVPCPA